MSAEEETYCRLCAEPTPKDQLITSEEDVAISSKIATKLLWINVDISSSCVLPSTICFSCFDLLERTWNFLHNVRTAQEKLWKIFVKEKNLGNDNKSYSQTGKPVNKDWDTFIELDTKPIVKPDPDDLEVITLDQAEFERIVKKEDSSDFDNGDPDFHTSDSDAPLQETVKKKRKKKCKVIFDTEISAEDLLKHETEVIPLDISMLTTNWDEYPCRCGTCDALLQNISSLQLHSIQIHHSCSIFKCSECGRVLSNYKSFINHARKHKRILRYLCEICNKQFPYVKKHINNEHTEVFKCRNCGAMFENEELLHDHLLIYGKEVRKSRKREKLEGLKCFDCNKEFKSKSNLQQHRLVHTERSRDFSCHVCGKMFFTKGTLSTHMNTHEDQKPFKCDICQMAFRARGNLQSHISLHTGAKPFICDQCGKSFRVKRHLKSHSIVHTDLMPYICEFCHKPFRFKTRLNLHLRQHTGAKPYNCIYCQRDFTNGSNFKKHMKRRHNVDTSRKKYNLIINQETTENSVSQINLT